MGTVVKELTAIKEALTPFAEKTASEFAAFLVKADEFDRNGSLKPAAKEPKPPRTTKPPAPNAADIAQEAKRIYDNAADPSVTMEQIGAIQERLGGLQKAGLLTVAETLGLKGMNTKTKPVILAEIRRMIEDRRGSKQRAGMIHPQNEGPSEAKAEQPATAGPVA